MSHRRNACQSPNCYSKTNAESPLSVARMSKRKHLSKSKREKIQLPGELERCLRAAPAPILRVETPTHETIASGVPIAASMAALVSLALQRARRRPAFPPASWGDVGMRTRGTGRTPENSTPRSGGAAHSSTPSVATCPTGRERLI